MVRRCLNLLVDCEPPLITFRKDERLDVLARGLLSRVMVIASQSRTALPLRSFIQVCGCLADPVGLTSLLKTCWCGHFLSLRSDTGVHSLGVRSRVRVSPAADDEMIS